LTSQLGGGVQKRTAVRPHHIKYLKMENSNRLAAATSRYFEQLDSHAIAEENSLAEDMVSAAKAIAFEVEM